MTNMYGDSVYQWNVCKGCNFGCEYCKPSFQAQAKRQKHRCMDCYEYTPHIHTERLVPSYTKRYFPKETKVDEFIWACSSGDIACMKVEWLWEVINVIKKHPHLTFFMQTKNPDVYNILCKPTNLLWGITLETNRDKGYPEISKAFKPSERLKVILRNNIPIDVITIEPILDFDYHQFIEMISYISPNRVYVGYNSKPKRVKLVEPSLQKTTYLIEALENMGIHVKTKLLREASKHD